MESGEKRKVYMVTDSQSNNFDILRFIGATLVLFSHSWPLSGSSGEIISKLSHELIDGGTLGVYLFFIISGFLITKSFYSRNKLIDFVKARVLRIFPALIVVTIISVFVLGPILTDLKFFDYINNSETYRYLFGNSFLQNLQFTLPGVFVGNQYGINGALWTLPVELFMYCVVAILGVFYLLKNRWVFNCLYVIIFILLFQSNIHFNIVEYRALMLYFLTGMLIYINRDVFAIRTDIYFIVCLIFILSYRIGLQSWIFPIVLIYSIFYLSYSPKIKLNL